MHCGPYTLPLSIPDNLQDAIVAVDSVDGELPPHVEGVVPMPAAPAAALVKYVPLTFPIANDDMSNESKLVIGTLASATAFDHGSALDIPLEASLQLRELGIVSCLPGNAASCFLNLSTVALERCPTATIATALVSQTLDRFKFDQASKVLVLQHLHLRGFKAKPMGTRFLEKGKAKQFCPRNIFLRLNYGRCLALADFLWKKPGGLKRILHEAPDEYYKALMKLKDLSAIADLTPAEVSLITNRQWKVLISTGKLPTAAAAAVADVADDHDHVDGEDGDDVKDVDDGSDSDVYTGALGVVGEKGLKVALVHDAAVDSKIDGLHTKVYFDHYTHHTGRLRAFVHCQDCVCMWLTRCLALLQPLDALTLVCNHWSQRCMYKGVSCKLHITYVEIGEMAMIWRFQMQVV